MAGLMDELMDVLESELEIYKNLIPLADTKSSIIIENDVKRLSEITDEEQIAIERLNSLEKKRESITANMRIVLNRKNSSLKIDELIELMEKQPEVREKLVQIRKELKDTISRLDMLNKRNSKLITQSLEISEYHLNMIRSSKGYIGNNYTRNAGQFDMSIMQSGTFDTRK